MVVWKSPELRFPMTPRTNPGRAVTVLDRRLEAHRSATATSRRGQQLVVQRFSVMVADAAGDPTLAEGTWVLLTEAVHGGWGL
jgi:hypothetical protein